jgi:NitT/TauT family transport system substrate-binding protein
MPRSLRPALAALLGLATAWALTACGTAAARPAAGPEKPDIVVAAVPAEGAAGLFIAQDDGLFAKAGLHVTIKDTEDPTTQVPALLHDSVDVLSGQYPTYIGADAKNVARIRIIAAGYELGPHVQEIMTGPKSPIRTPQQLKGKTIAVNAPNSVTTDLLYTSLAPYGITPADVHIAVFGFPAMGLALAEHKVDAIYEVEPYVTEASEAHGDNELLDVNAGPAQGFPINGYGVLASWEKKYPRDAKAFAWAIEQGNRIATTNAKRREQALVTSLHMSPQVAAVVAAGTFPTTVDAKKIQRDADMMLQFGQLAKPFNVAAITGP